MNEALTSSEVATRTLEVATSTSGNGETGVTPGFQVRMAALAMESGRFDVLEKDRWAGYRRLQARLVESLQEVYRWRLAARVAACHRDFKAYRCRPEGTTWAKPGYTCKLRLCPFEMRAAAMRALHRLGPAVDHLRDGKYLVLSQRNCGLYELGKGIDDLWASFNRLKKSSVWVGVRLKVVTLEITYNCEAKTWHPHLNVVFEGPFIPQNSLVAAWIKATEGAGRIVHIQAVDTGTARELLKYITKLADFVDEPEAVDQFITATYRRRFLRTYGDFRRLGLEEECDSSRCPDCGSDDIEYLGNIAMDRVYLDVKGVLRIRNCSFPLPSRDGPGDG